MDTPDQNTTEIKFFCINDPVHVIKSSFRLSIFCSNIPAVLSTTGSKTSLQTKTPQKSPVVGILQWPKCLLNLVDDQWFIQVSSRKGLSIFYGNREIYSRSHYETRVPCILPTTTVGLITATHCLNTACIPWHYSQTIISVCPPQRLQHILKTKTWIKRSWKVSLSHIIHRGTKIC